MKKQTVKLLFIFLIGAVAVGWLLLPRMQFREVSDSVQKGSSALYKLSNTRMSPSILYMNLSVYGFASTGDINFQYDIYAGSDPTFMNYTGVGVINVAFDVQYLMAGSATGDSRFGYPAVFVAADLEVGDHVIRDEGIVCSVTSTQPENARTVNAAVMTYPNGTTLTFKYDKPTGLLLTMIMTAGTSSSLYDYSLVETNIF